MEMGWSAWLEWMGESAFMPAVIEEEGKAREDSHVHSRQTTKVTVLPPSYPLSRHHQVGDVPISVPTNG